MLYGTVISQVTLSQISNFHGRSMDRENLGIGGTHFGRPIRLNFIWLPPASGTEAGALPPFCLIDHCRAAAWRTNQMISEIWISDRMSDGHGHLEGLFGEMGHRPGIGRVGKWSERRFGHIAGLCDEFGASFPCHLLLAQIHWSGIERKDGRKYFELW
jgi:hypothetical protein